MKKLLSSAFLLLILLFILLVLSGWYFNASAEQVFREYLSKTSEVSGRKLFRIELQSYNKTLFGAKANLKISSDIPIIAEQLSSIEVVAKLLNGPLFVTKNGVSMGSSRWFVSLDESNLSDVEKENISILFPEFLPNIIIRTDFERKVHYSSRLHTNITQLDVKGLFDLTTENNAGNAVLQNFQYDSQYGKFLAESVSVNYQHQRGITSAYNPGTVAISIPKLIIDHKGVDGPIKLALNITNNISQTDQYLDSFSRVKIQQLGDQQIPLEKATISLMLKGLSSKGFLRFSAKQAELDNLKQQAQWSLQEVGEFPEGQDQIWQLHNEIDEKSRLLPSIILNEMISEDSVIQLKAESQNISGKSELMAEFKRINASAASTEKSIEKEGGGFYTLLSLLQGKANIKLDKKFYSFLQNFLPIKQSEFQLILTDSKLLMQ